MLSVALLHDVPTEVGADPLANEVTADGYARQPVGLAGGLVRFPIATTHWGTIRGFAIVNAEGRVHYAGPFTLRKQHPVSTGDAFQLDVGGDFRAPEVGSVTSTGPDKTDEVIRLLRLILEEQRATARLLRAELSERRQAAGRPHSGRAA